uniref:histidine kinase n=1 Tax=Chromera velia CCMP2878 TaxID=1169474 RepID=A0A0G4G1B1_9ALVE|eukprot:Cvel_19687.t1-p1 / transcript=Cvel_19687.t1 / gene=Cvel_19687 / organism=Chromera_velia_CCMP2878 / gene_product=Hybrid signal transduction histidine kinase K, putative / transcript_product=Hybrid signal transduction histidine kinase K, putative / location=Cvel_scaffold1717:23934-33547(+) / protein_length=1356 / sequence_SO=supercontig / SO=protein_coding / is_pseudo=false
MPKGVDTEGVNLIQAASAVKGKRRSAIPWLVVTGAVLAAIGCIVGVWCYLESEEVAKTVKNRALEYVSRFTELTGNTLERSAFTVYSLTIAPGDLSADFFKTWALHGQDIAQVRHIDNVGMEVIRVDVNMKHKTVVATDDLQNKDDRYYTQAALKLPRNSFFVSPIDLNEEFGVVETPWSPVYRLAVARFDADTGDRDGFVIVNYNATHILSSMNSSGLTFGGATGEWNILSQGLHFLASSDKSARLFGNSLNESRNAVFSEDASVAASMKSVLSELKEPDSGCSEITRVMTREDGGVAAFSVIDLCKLQKADSIQQLEPRCNLLDKEYSAMLIGLVNIRNEQLQEAINAQLMPVYIAAPVCLVLLGVVSFILYKFNEKSIQARQSDQSHMFLSSLAHDLRSPLNVMMSSLDMMDSPEIRALYSYRILRTAIDTMTMLMSNVTFAYKLDSIKASAPQPRNIRQDLISLAESYSFIANPKLLFVEVDIDTRLPSLVLIEWQAMQQGLGNLISNAIKFTHRGGIVIRCSTSSLKDAGGSNLLELEASPSSSSSSPTAPSQPSQVAEGGKQQGNAAEKENHRDHRQPETDESFGIRSTSPAVGALASTASSGSSFNLTFSVDDSGPGMSQTDPEKAGLGLNITNRIVKALGGLLSVHKMEPNGTRVLIENIAVTGLKQATRRQPFPSGPMTPRGREKEREAAAGPAAEKGDGAESTGTESVRGHLNGSISVPMWKVRRVVFVLPRQKGIKPPPTSIVSVTPPTASKSAAINGTGTGGEANANQPPAERAKENGFHADRQGEGREQGKLSSSPSQVSKEEEEAHALHPIGGLCKKGSPSLPASEHKIDHTTTNQNHIMHQDLEDIQSEAKFEENHEYEVIEGVRNITEMERARMEHFVSLMTAPTQLTSTDLPTLLSSFPPPSGTSVPSPGSCSRGRPGLRVPASPEEPSSSSAAAATAMGGGGGRLTDIRRPPTFSPESQTATRAVTAVLNGTLQGPGNVSPPKSFKVPGGAEGSEGGPASPPVSNQEGGGGGSPYPGLRESLVVLSSQVRSSRDSGGVREGEGNENEHDQEGVEVLVDAVRGVLSSGGGCICLSLAGGDMGLPDSAVKRLGAHRVVFPPFAPERIWEAARHARDPLRRQGPSGVWTVEREGDDCLGNGHSSSEGGLSDHADRAGRPRSSLPDHFPAAAHSCPSPYPESPECPSRGGGGGFRLSRLRVCVVDDTAVNRQVLVLLLKHKFSISASEAESGKRFLELIDGGMRFDLVFMDRHMPDMSGCEATENLRLRGDAGSPLAPFVCGLSGDDDEGAKRECLDAGMNLFHSKPMPSETLRGVLELVSKQLEEGVIRGGEGATGGVEKS